MSELKDKVKAAQEQPPAGEQEQAAPVDRRQPDPKTVKLVKQFGPDGKPEDRPPVPPKATSGGTVPRLIHQNERAVDGLTRFKVSARNYNPRPVRYILARTEQEARSFYLLSTGLDYDMHKQQVDAEAALEMDLRKLRVRAIHSPDMAQAAERLASELQTIRVVRSVPEPELVVTRLAD